MDTYRLDMRWREHTPHSLARAEIANRLRQPQLTLGLWTWNLRGRLIIELATASLVQCPLWHFAVRQLLKNPGFVLAVTLTLAFGVGVNTAVFSLVDGFILRRLPYTEPDRIGVLVLHVEGISERTGQFERQDSTSQDGQTWGMIRSGVPGLSAASSHNRYRAGSRSSFGSPRELNFPR